MRTRARTANTTIPAGGESRLWLTITPGKIESVPTASYVYQSLNETMTDELPLKKRSGSCYHSKTTTWYALGENMVFGPWGSSPSYKSTVSGSCLYKYVLLDRMGSNANLGTILTPSSFDWRNASYHAVKQMRPSVEDGLLLPNYIAELAELGRQVRGIARKRMNSAEHAGSKLRKQRRSVTVQSLWKETVGYIQGLARTAASANLAWQFCVKPTISDAKKIASLIEEYSSKLSKLIEQAGTRQTRHYARPVDNLFSLPASTTVNLSTLFGSSNSCTRSSEWLTRPMYRASMLFTYDASALRDQLGRLHGLLHAFGVTRVASILWEAIPFSFVVDWFVNIGDMIGNIEDQLIDPLPIVIHDFSHSLKYGYRTRLRWTWNTKIVTDLGYRAFEVYERRRDVPSLWDSLSVRLPNLNQTGLGLSLIILSMDGITNWKRR